MLLLVAAAGCAGGIGSYPFAYGEREGVGGTGAPNEVRRERGEGEPYQVGVLALEGAYGSELTAPHEVLEHALRAGRPATRVFTVGRSLEPVETFEGITILPDFPLGAAPRIDVLVLPGVAGSDGALLGDRGLVRWIAERSEQADWVIALSDAVFLAAEAGILEGRRCTSHPESIPLLRRLHPGLDIVEGVSFVADGNVVTAAGGAVSYEPALFVEERLLGKGAAEETGRGLVLDWQLDAVAHDAGGAGAAPGEGGRPSCYLPGERVDPGVTLETASGEALQLGGIVSGLTGARGIALCILGGAEGADRARRGGLWCEDSFDDLPLLRHLILHYEPLGIRFVAVLCPPVHDEAAFGYDEGAFLRRGEDDPVYRENRARFVEGSLRLRERDVLPFERIFFDPRFRLLADPDREAPPGEAAPPPSWQGRFKWYQDTQSYGTPTLWVLEPDLTVFGAPFFMNVYESKGGRIRYTVRDVAARLDRLLRGD